LRRTS
jgi:hypothetical protein